MTTPVSESAVRGAFALGLAALLLLAAARSGYGQQREIRYRDRISGAAAPAAFDVSGDGLPAHYVTFDGWSTLGMVNGALLVEYDFPNLAPDLACPAGTLKLPILASAGNRALTVRALGLEGGQLLMRDKHEEALLCLDPAKGSFTMSLSGVIEGGLGIFEGATGEYSYEGHGQVLIQDTNMLPFGGFTLETEGTIVLPRR